MSCSGWSAKTVYQTSVFLSRVLYASGAKKAFIEALIDAMHAQPRVLSVIRITRVRNVNLITTARVVSMIALTVSMSLVLITMALVPQFAMLVIIIKETMYALCVGKHVKNVLIMITVLSALKEHIFNMYLEIAIAQIARQIVKVALVAPGVHNARRNINGAHTVRICVRIVLVVVIK